MEPDELRQAVLKTRWVFPKLADAIVDWVYKGQGVNRLFYEDYVRFLRASPFRVLHLTPAREHVPGKVQVRLERACREYVDFSVRMVEIVLQKP